MAVTFEIPNHIWSTIGKAKICLRGGRIFTVFDCFFTIFNCFYMIFKKLHLPETYFGLYNLWSRMHSYGDIAIWNCNFWYGCPCMKTRFLVKSFLAKLDLQIVLLLPFWQFIWQSLKWSKRQFLKFSNNQIRFHVKISVLQFWSVFSSCYFKKCNVTSFVKIQMLLSHDVLLHTLTGFDFSFLKVLNSKFKC